MVGGSQIIRSWCKRLRQAHPAHTEENLACASPTLLRSSTSKRPIQTFHTNSFSPAQAQRRLPHPRRPPV